MIHAENPRSAGQMIRGGPYALTISNLTDAKSPEDSATSVIAGRTLAELPTAPTADVTVNGTLPLPTQATDRRCAVFASVADVDGNARHVCAPNYNTGIALAAKASASIRARSSSGHRRRRSGAISTIAFSMNCSVRSEKLSLTAHQELARATTARGRELA